MPRYQKQLLLLMMFLLIKSISLICQPANCLAQGLVSQDHQCLSCHQGILDQLPKYVHKPFVEEKCYHCHKFQFPAVRRHKFTFNHLAPENTYYFRIKEFSPDEPANLTEPESGAMFVSAIYSFLPPTLGGVAMNFSDSEYISQMELSTSGWNTSTALLTWETKEDGYCLVEFDITDSLSQAKTGHATDKANGVYLKEIGITACYQCHPKEELGISHPVDVYPSDKVREKMGKSDLPTGKNGLLLCITCHLPHASDKKYLGQRLVAEELCVACHPKEIYNPE